jgi:hypothetical protein
LMDHYTRCIIKPGGKMVVTDSSISCHASLITVRSPSVPSAMASLCWPNFCRIARLMSFRWFQTPEMADFPRLSWKAREGTCHDTCNALICDHMNVHFGLLISSSCAIAA